MHEVVLKSIPAKRAEHVIRVVHKHNRMMNHHEHEAVVARVMAGGSEVIAKFGELHSAENVLKELTYHGAVGEIRSAN